MAEARNIYGEVKLQDRPRGNGMNLIERFARLALARPRTLK
jgi:hypothetical protein